MLHIGNVFHLRENFASHDEVHKEEKRREIRRFVV